MISTCQGISGKFIDLYLFLLFIFIQPAGIWWPSSLHAPMKTSMYISWFQIMSCAFFPSHLSWCLCCNIFYLPFVDLELMDSNFDITVYNVFHRFHHHHFFLKTDEFSDKTATSNICYYFFSFYQRHLSTEWLAKMTHNKFSVETRKNPTVLIYVFIFNLQSRHNMLRSDGTMNLKLNIQELLTKYKPIASLQFLSELHHPPRALELPFKYLAVLDWFFTLPIAARWLSSLLLSRAAVS